MNTTFQEMVHAWSTGGWVMPALALLGLVIYANAAHLLYTLRYRGLTRASDPDVRLWVATPAKAPRKLRELIRYTQDEVSSIPDIEGRFREVETSMISDVDRRITFLNVLVVGAPLFGLLGTVLGMLLTFKAIGIGGGSASEIVSKGISEALVATQTGMMVAIPGLVVAYMAKRQRNELVAFLARLECITLRHFRPQFHGMTRVFVRPGGPRPNPAPPPSAIAPAPVPSAAPQQLPA
ncbi:MAG: MotA/TolQ/ExbB proton channel family protein [Verrucomicrobia bacterium]|nr:MotA/TolQ/ExbB proton channel family protein [Verrucomicrobiota bacterium]